MAKHLFVVASLRDVKVKDGAKGAAKRFRGKMLHENLMLEVADGRVKGSKKVTEGMLPEYIYTKLASGRNHLVYNFSNAYADGCKLFGLTPKKLANNSKPETGVSIPEPPAEVKAAGQPSIEEIMAEAEVENAKRDILEAENAKRNASPRKRTASDLSKMTKADLVAYVISLQA